MIKKLKARSRRWRFYRPYAIRLNVTRTHHGVGVGSPLQVVATLGVGVRSDAKAVGRVELLHQEGAARLDHGGQLEQAGGREQRLDGVLPQLQAACGSQRSRIGLGPR